MTTAPRPTARRPRSIDVPVGELRKGLVVEGLGFITAAYHRLGTTTVYVDGVVRHYHHDQHSTAPVRVDAIAGGLGAIATPTGRRILEAA